jgi:hypothetical protein
MFYSTVMFVIYTNKLSLVGMQLPRKYKENFDVSSEGPSTPPPPPPPSIIAIYTLKMFIKIPSL